MDGKVSSGSGATLAALDLYHSTPFIDFHFNRSTNDYTSRIIEYAQSKLGVQANVFNVQADLQISGKEVPTKEYVDDKTKFFNYCSLDYLVTQTGVSKTDSTYSFFNSSNLKTGFYFGTASGGLLKGMTTNTYNSYILFKANTNFGKLLVMPTNSSVIYMLDAQKSDTWYTLHS